MAKFQASIDFHHLHINKRYSEKSAINGKVQKRGAKERESEREGKRKVELNSQELHFPGEKKNEIDYLPLCWLSIIGR